MSSFLNSILSEVNGTPAPPPSIPLHKRAELESSKPKENIPPKQPGQDASNGKYIPPHKRPGYKGGSATSPNKNTKGGKLPESRRQLAPTPNSQKNVLAGSRAGSSMARAMPRPVVKKAVVEAKASPPPSGRKKAFDYKSLVTDQLSDKKSTERRRGVKATPATNGKATPVTKTNGTSAKKVDDNTPSYMDEKWWTLREPDRSKIKPIYADSEIKDGRFILKSPYGGIQFAFNWRPSPKASPPTAVKKAVAAPKPLSKLERAASEPPLKAANTKADSPINLDTNSSPKSSPLATVTDCEASFSLKRPRSPAKDSGSALKKSGVKRVRFTTDADEPSDAPPRKKLATASTKVTRAKADSNASSDAKEAVAKVSATTSTKKGIKRPLEAEIEENPVDTKASSKPAATRKIKQPSTKATKGKGKAKAVGKEEDFVGVEKSCSSTTSKALKAKASTPAVETSRAAPGIDDSTTSKALKAKAITAKTSSSLSSSSSTSSRSKYAKARKHFRIQSDNESDSDSSSRKRARLDYDTRGRRLDGRGVAKLVKKSDREDEKATVGEAAAIPGVPTPISNGKQSRQGTTRSSGSPKGKRKTVDDTLHDDDEDAARSSKRRK
ncbi:hypothetical protein DM02DRAFT_659025 [Periconia macrospinosa]|uniref:Uncharacterized protein n=1 Tax=Periconia macrospinosa TaxID=97972 RepID=A0A2V1DEL7_9PLEO|nr:hypothetical protein DM02DRAFT_659025 [Periconia macrospinosa]